MSKVIYSMSVSLDGYVETPDRGIEWTDPDDELHAFFNDHQRNGDGAASVSRLMKVDNVIGSSRRRLGARLKPGATIAKPLRG